ncbi:lysophospholipase L1-like esterase [Microbacterium endophyticum]|uniref:Lysophospholipase L1-like esterase n=1 Tax=Microbacterium endophyticum TaxID=1526412 RepID=A0A7W4V557_9MICO|nr:SGNH/GDSL hydrolase family protein [Microbacterium endophyticum]MBB2976714.1 lysophospholipase L1-like esterase [Microbacterium endophyticum]NIK36650.1 lysophospholipase L1-like esterase [Microbacterium endophyticum]
MNAVRYVAIGDSFTEGVGDELPDRTVRGWADLVARGWAAASGAPVDYANLAIRGRLAWPIVAQQLEPALALKPTHLSFNGGGNDMLRPRTSIAHIADAFAHVLRRCKEEGVHAIMLSGANPSKQLPLGRLIQRRGDLLTAAASARLAGDQSVTTAFNWPDQELSQPTFWSEDRLHLNSRGHHRVAARVLTSLGLEPPGEWWRMPELANRPQPNSRDYFREHLGPWIRRRVTRTSSGDGRLPKLPEFVAISPSFD